MKGALNAIHFSERILYQRNFEKWCESISDKTQICPTLTSAIIWMQATTEGKELVTKLYNAMTEKGDKNV